MSKITNNQAKLQTVAKSWSCRQENESSHCRANLWSTTLYKWILLSVFVEKCGEMYSKNILKIMKWSSAV